MNKRILLVNPSVNASGVPHGGLAILSAVLRGRGHEVKVADYNFSSKTRALEEILETFDPEVVGISLFSCMASRVDGIINAIKAKGLPLVCGGPHAASYYEELIRDGRFDVVVAGEGEEVIANVMENAEAGARPKLIRAPLPDVGTLPFPDYGSFYGYEEMSVYPLITSRGCPFNCSFCSIELSNSRRWRPRTVAACIEEIKGVKERLLSVREIMVWDDNFSLDIKRAKDFLREFIGDGFGYKLRLANVRADSIDKEFLLLLREAGCDEIQFGVEHGDEDVFGGIGKGETLEDIKRAAQLVNSCGLKLGCSFIIGLPGDTLEKVRASVRLAKTLNADHVHWNILVPYKGTRSYRYFKEHGRVDDSRIPFTLPGDDLFFEPNADTPEFPAEERKKAYLSALLLSGDVALAVQLSNAASASIKYRLGGEFILWLLSVRVVRAIASRGWHYFSGLWRAPAGAGK